MKNALRRVGIMLAYCVALFFLLWPLALFMISGDMYALIPKVVGFTVFVWLIKRFIVEKLNIFFNANFSITVIILSTLFFVDIIMFFNQVVLQKIPSGIELPFGWSDSCSGNNFGFPFNAYSDPGSNALCGGSTNAFASLLNLFLLAILMILFIRIIMKAYKRA